MHGKIKRTLVISCTIMAALFLTAGMVSAQKTKLRIQTHLAPEHDTAFDYYRAST